MQFWSLFYQKQTKAPASQNKQICRSHVSQKQAYREIDELLRYIKRVILNGCSRSGFLTGVEDMVVLFKKGSMAGGGGGLKMLSKNTCEVVYLIVKLPAISLQA